ncbi:hypothetical protein [Synechococcus sp. PCC 7335]|uniref:hypothetical protein n=1 Tax=Synechococcus sp. (strain ATCC 29403 / PCC 7335) TaxID=91464 RepID=UPI001D0D772C|nr:hypothetical protein [Synechococcus sp. PCC 7335]
MTKNLKSKSSTMFDTLAKKSSKRGQSKESPPSVTDIAADLKADQSTTDFLPSEPATQRRKRAKTGKRSDPSYTQVGCYIPKDLNSRVKVRLVEDSRDFSDLVAELLNEWLAD